MLVINSHLKRREYLYYCIYDIRMQIFFFRGEKEGMGERAKGRRGERKRAASNTQQATGR
jgi:hypothetical protein